MATAFGISVDDVENVLQKHGVTHATEDELINLLESLDVGRVEKAALAGDDMDEQTNYAMDDIALQLKENGFLP